MKIPKKGDLKDCSNWRGITLLIVASKVLGKILIPKTTWRRTVEKERSDAGWRSWEQARACARDRDSWRKRV